MKRLLLFILLSCPVLMQAQINTKRVMMIARNALYFEDYVLSIQYFNQVIGAKPYLYEPYFYRSLAKLNLEDYVGSEQDCDSTISRNPFVVSAYQVRGLSRIRQSNYKGAISDYQKVLEMDPENLNTWQNLTLCHLQEKEYDKALEDVSSMKKVNPHYATSYLLQGEVNLARKDTTQAKRDFDEAIALAPYEAGAYGARGRLLLNQKKYQDAEADFTQALHLDNKGTEYLINRALARFHQQNLRGAMKDYDLALSITPHSFIGHYNRGILRAQVGDDNRALEDFDFVLTIDPSDMMATFNRGLLRLKTGNNQGAATDFTTVIEKYPLFKTGYHYRAEAYRKMGAKLAAVKDEDKLLQLNIDSYNARTNASQKKSDVAKKTTNGTSNDADSEDDDTRKRSDKNLANYRKLVIADEEESSRKYESDYRGRVQNKNVSIRPQNLFALNYYEKNSEVRNIVHYDKSIENLNKSGLLPVLLHITNQEAPLTQEQVDKHFNLIDKHTEDITKNPLNATLFFARALDFYLVQDFDAAIHDLTIAIRLDGQFSPAYFMRAVVRAKQTEYQQAEVRASHESADKTSELRRHAAMDYELVVKDLNEVISITPDFAYAYYNRAYIYSLLRNYKAAVNDYNQALKLEKNMASAYYNRGITELFLGDDEPGIQDLSRAGELGIVSAYNIIKRYSK